MTKPHLTQRVRLLLLLVDVGILLLASWIGFGSIIPANDDRGIWFYSALLGLLLGSRLDTPFFVAPADVVLYAAPAGITLLLANSWASWSPRTQALFGLALGYVVIALALGMSAIATHGSRNPKAQRVSNASRILAEACGTPVLIYSALVGFALFAFHWKSPREFASVTAAWLFTAVAPPFDAFVYLWWRLRRVFDADAIHSHDGEVVAYQNPGVLLVRQDPGRLIARGAQLVVRDAIASVKHAVALDIVGRDEGVLVRAIEVIAREEEATADLKSLPSLPINGVACKSNSGRTVFDDGLVGIVAPDTTIERLFFEVVKDDEVEEGRLVEVSVRGQRVLYQIVNGLTREEVVRQRNTHGYARAQAQKIGRWDEAEKRFKSVKWLPRPNSPVYLKGKASPSSSREAIGHFPGTDFLVTLRDIHSLVTHNTAILGILGVGKSSLTFELIERMLAERVKVVCIDITGQYQAELDGLADTDMHAKLEQALSEATVNGKTNYQRNVEEGGSRGAFAGKVAEVLRRFMAAENDRFSLMIINPARFEVWRQDSKMFDGKASMASVTPAEITQMISEAALEAVSALGMTDQARLCLVYEEAHALIPEWNSATADGDRTASNGTARAILQGRKYGMGCILVTQRTANVTKTILNQCNTIFAMRTFDDTGKGFLANYVGAEYSELLPSLSERHAVLYGKASSCENPVLVRLNDRVDFMRAFRQPVRAPEQCLDANDARVAATN